MRLVIFDSRFGNTMAIAQAIAESLSAESRPIADADEALLSGVDLLVVGSPTQGGHPTTAMQSYLDALPATVLASKKVAAFDTRISAADRSLPLRLLMKLIGYAGPRIAKTLRAKGGELVAPAEGFIVEGREGPLRDGELERAKRWLDHFNRA